MSDPEATSHKTSELPSEITSTPSNPNPGCRYYGPNGEVLSRHPQDISPAESVQDGVEELVQGDQQHQKCDEARKAVTDALNSTIEGQHNTMVDQLNTIAHLHHQISGYQEIVRTERQLFDSCLRTHVTAAATASNPQDLLSPKYGAEYIVTIVRDWGAAQGFWPSTTSVNAPRVVPGHNRSSEAPVWDPRPDQKPTRVFGMEFKGKSADAVGESKSTEQTEEQGGTTSAAVIGDSTPRGRPLHRHTIPGHLVSNEFRWQSNLHQYVLPQEQSSRIKPYATPQASTEAESSSRTTLPLPHKIDPTLKDAGHTSTVPSNLSKLFSMDGTAGEKNSGSTSKGEVEKTPLETPTTSQEPMKRSKGKFKESYFGSVMDSANAVIGPSPGLSEVPSLDEDIPLKGQLGLTNSPENEQNKAFMGEVDKKLSQVNLLESAGNMKSPSRSQPTGDPSKASPSNVDPALKNVDGSLCETPEEDPPLRIKENKNFGSAMGKGTEVDYGKGFAKNTKKDPDNSGA